MVDLILYQYMDEMLRQTTEKHFRYLYQEIEWSARMIGIVGPRGVGKSTMLLQHIKNHPNRNKMLYVSADIIYFNTHTLVDLADELVKDGGNYLFIDEVHKYKNWSQELKQIYDVHPDLHVVFTGSSILDIYEGLSDLSRRVLLYHLQGLSFREFLLIQHEIEAPVLTLKDIVDNKAVIPDVSHPLPLFREYLAKDLKPATARKLKQLLSVVSSLAPYKPNFDNLSKEVGISKNNVPDYLTYLEKAGLLGLLRDNTSGMRSLGKIEKVYVDNPSLMTVLSGGTPNVGNLRETFFYNQTRLRNNVMASRIRLLHCSLHLRSRREGQRQTADRKC